MTQHLKKIIRLCKSLLIQLPKEKHKPQYKPNIHLLSNELPYLEIKVNSFMSKVGKYLPLIDCRVWTSERPLRIKLKVEAYGVSGIDHLCGDSYIDTRTRLNYLNFLTLSFTFQGFF